MASAVHEIKAQAAVEMAQDPNSSVTAEAAQKKIVDESNKAGVPAFTFDPDASPEEKAAQARAVSDRIAGPGTLTDIIFFGSVCRKVSTTSTIQPTSLLQRIWRRACQRNTFSLLPPLRRLWRFQRRPQRKTKSHSQMERLWIQMKINTGLSGLAGHHDSVLVSM
jgi:hypothetical protein